MPELAKEQSQAELLVSLDLRRGDFTFEVSAPNLEVALTMARWAADELGRLINEAWLASRKSIIVPARTTAGLEGYKPD
jgi:hypothetical protein